MKTIDALKLALLLILSTAACHCYPNIQPAHAKDTVCKTTCRTDSGGNLICKTRCR